MMINQGGFMLKTKLSSLIGWTGAGATGREGFWDEKYFLTPKNNQSPNAPISSLNWFEAIARSAIIFTVWSRSWLLALFVPIHLNHNQWPMTLDQWQFRSIHHWQLTRNHWKWWAILWCIVSHRSLIAISPSNLYKLCHQLNWFNAPHAFVS